MIKPLAFLLAFSAPALAQPLALDDIAGLPEADVVWLGEVHDNPAHHANQAQIIAAINPAALVFEMLTEDQAARVTPQTRQSADRLRDALDWDASGWPDFAMYYPLFTAAPEAAIFGAELPREQAREVMGAAPAEVFAGDAARFGLDQPLPREQQQARETLQARAHCDALPEDMLPMMVDIQRLRDAMLAQSALAAHAATGGPVAVITGTGHARIDWGAPTLLAKAAPELRQISIGQFEEEIDAPPHDFWLITAPHPRPDPCDAFR